VSSSGKPPRNPHTQWKRAEGTDADRAVELLSGGGEDVRLFVRKVHDGDLSAIVTGKPMVQPSETKERRWQLSVSHEGNAGNRRYPSLDELSHACTELLPDGVRMVMLMPPRDVILSLQNTILHLREMEQSPVDDQLQR